MKEQLITFDTAKLAKEKGFNDHFYHKKGEDSSRWWKCKHCYDPEDETKTLQLWSDNIFNSTDERLERLVSAPTQSLLQKWLLEVKHINIELTFDDGQWLVYVGEFSFPDSSVKLFHGIECDGFKDAIFKKSIALEKGLQEALKLIK